MSNPDRFRELNEASEPPAPRYRPSPTELVEFLHEHPEDPKYASRRIEQYIQLQSVELMIDQVLVGGKYHQLKLVNHQCYNGLTCKVVDQLILKVPRDKLFYCGSVETCYAGWMDVCIRFDPGINAGTIVRIYAIHPVTLIPPSSS